VTVKLWDLLRAGNTVARYSLDDYGRDLTSAYGNFGLYGSGTSPYQKTEDIENSFAGYTQAAYKSNGVVFAVILTRLLLFSEARFQWQRINSGRPGDLFGTADLALLEMPWPNGTTGELLARMEQDASLAGNFYAVREAERLRRLRPDWVTIVLSAPPAEATQSDVIGYWYHPGRVMAGLEPTSTDELFLPEETCHWSPVPDPDAQYRGMSWLTPVVREIQADRAATEHKLRFFENGATLGPVISLKETVTAEQFKEFIAETNAAHKGVENAYKPLYVGGGADVTLATADMRQLDFKGTQGAGETRICAAGHVPPIIVGLSEGLQASTYSNYAQARRAFGDGWARPQWRSACAALASITDVPAGTTPGTVRLWYDDRDIAFLREDQADAAKIAQTVAITIRTYTDAGFEPKSAVAAAVASDPTLLVHSGLYSVQLTPPGTAAAPGSPAAEGTLPAPEDTPADEPAPDTNPDEVEAP
jgi:phage portal protein BeeE